MSTPGRTDDGLMPVGEFLHHHGERCPCCRSDETLFEDYPQYDRGTCISRCTACGSRWEDTIVLTGYRILEAADGA